MIVIERHTEHTIEECVRIVWIAWQIICKSWFAAVNDGDGCFAAAGLRLWNFLPAFLSDKLDTDSNFEQFWWLLTRQLWLTVKLRLLSQLAYLWQGPQCVRVITYSGWNPPPGNRKMHGDLLYLYVVMLEDKKYHITASTHGFFLNQWVQLSGFKNILLSLFSCRRWEQYNCPLLSYGLSENAKKIGSKMLNLGLKPSFWDNFSNPLCFCQYRIRALCYHIECKEFLPVTVVCWTTR